MSFSSRINAILSEVVDSDGGWERAGGREKLVPVFLAIARIWNKLAELDTRLPKIYFDNMDYPYLDVYHIGDKWGSAVIAQTVLDQATHITELLDEVVDQVLIQHGLSTALLNPSWDANRGRQDLGVVAGPGSSSVPMDYGEYEEYQQDNEPSAHEVDFLSGIYEARVPQWDPSDPEMIAKYGSERDAWAAFYRQGQGLDEVENQNRAVDVEAMIDWAKNASGDELARRAVAEPSPMMDYLVSIMAPEFKSRRGRYGLTVSNNEPPWLDVPDKLVGVLEKRGIPYRWVRIDLHDAEREFPVDLFTLLSSHNVSGGRTIGWASAIYLTDHKILVVIEIQSDVLRSAAKFMRTAEEIDQDTQSRQAGLGDLEALYGDKIPYDVKRKFEHMRLTPYEVKGAEHAVAKYAGLRGKLMDALGDWDDALLDEIISHGSEIGAEKIKFPTARRLGRFWRAGGENPNMRVLKATYDKKLRDIATKENDWWTIDL